MNLYEFPEKVKYQIVLANPILCVHNQTYYYLSNYEYSLEKGNKGGKVSDKNRTFNKER